MSMAATLWCAAPVAHAQDGDDPSFLAVGVGWYDMNRQTNQAAEFRAEWRGKRSLWIFKPMAGVMATSDAALYGYGGVLLDIYFGRRVVFSPSIAAGAYHNGNGKDLGSVVEFRSSAELAYRFDDRSRIGINFYHISNAHIGDKNPGTEVLSLTYAIPLN
jgi:hypothetical protein